MIPNLLAQFVLGQAAGGFGIYDWRIAELETSRVGDRRSGAGEATVDLVQEGLREEADFASGWAVHGFLGTIRYD
jgi:hypothetical protein